VQLSRYYLGLSARRKIIRVYRLDLSRHRAGALLPCAMLSIALSSSCWHSRIRRPCAGLKEVFTRFRGSVQVNNSNCGFLFKLQVKLGSRWVYACSVFIGRWCKTCIPTTRSRSESTDQTKPHRVIVWRSIKNRRLRAERPWSIEGNWRAMPIALSGSQEFEMDVVWDRIPWCTIKTRWFLYIVLNRFNSIWSGVTSAELCLLKSFITTYIQSF
jgi:hypothetical protein